MRSPLPVVLLASISTCVGAACFELEPRVDAGIGDEPEGVIAGRVSIGDASGQAAGGANVARDMLTGARANPTERDVPLRDVEPRADPRDGDPTSRNPRDAQVKAQAKRSWSPGVVLVRFAPRAYDQTSITPVLRAMFHEAGYSDARFAVTRCTARQLCRLEVRAADGRPLDAAATQELARALAKHKRGAVTTVSVNHHVTGFRRPNDDFYGYQWHYQFIHLEPAWDLEIGSDDVVVAVVDSGGVLAHPDLQSRWARDPQNNQIVGMDLVSEEFDADDAPGRDTNPEDPGDQLYGDRSSFHGTHIAGTIGAATDNTVGVAGVTWRSRIVPVRVLGVGLGGSVDDIIAGLFWAIGDPDVPDVPDNVAPARVVNLSFGGAVDEDGQALWDEIFSYIFEDVDDLYDNPVFIAAVGNDDTDAQFVAPANVPGMIAVGAVRSIDGIRAGYSNYGSVVDIMGPGGDNAIDLTQDGQGDAILSTWQNDYDWEQGTSMSAPHVTGVAALLVAQNPSLTQPQVESILKDAADPAGQCNEGCGAGWLDAFAALLLAGGEIEPVPRMAADTANVFFGDGVATRTIHVVNTGNVAFDYQAVITGAQAQLFTVTPEAGTVAAADANGIVPLTIALERNGFESGSANLEITTVGIEPPQTVRVDIQFNDDPNRVPRTVETIQVAAYVADDDGNLESVQKTTTTRADNFAYEITGLAAGSYFVFAVADDNRDNDFDANAESLGGYPTTRAPEAVVVEEDTRVEDIDFSVKPNFITGVLGGVGEPCDTDNDCTFAPDAQCITSFAGGYCSRLCEDDGECGDSASCEVLDCDEGPCPVCLVTCLSDARCRFGDGYVCDEYGTCTPQEL